MFTRLRLYGLTAATLLGLTAPASAQLWKPNKKKPAAAKTTPKAKTSATATPRKASRPTKPKRKISAKRRAPAPAPAAASDEFDDDPIIVIEDP